MIFSKTGLCLDEKTYTIFINTKADESLIPEELKPYCRYLNSGKCDENDEFIRDLHDHVIEVNKDPEWRGVLMTLREEIRMQYRDEIEAAAMKASEEARKEAIIQGRAEANEENIKVLVTLVKSGKLKYEDALSAVPDPDAFAKEFENNI